MSRHDLLPNEKKVSAADIGLTHKDIHEAGQVLDADLFDQVWCLAA